MIKSLDYLADCKAQRMPYWDRAKVAKDRGLMFTVYVPVLGALTWIARGSGIVGLDCDNSPEGRRAIFYEGDIYTELFGKTRRAYSELVYHAADRMAVDYPTVAKALVPIESLVPVGTFDYARTDLEITDQVALDAWRA